MEQTASQWIEVGSRAFEAYRYDKDTNTIDIRFKANSMYRYENFTPDVYKEFMNAPSMGSFVIQTLVKNKEQFPYHKISAEEAD